VKPTLPTPDYTRLHLRFGWWSVFVFAAFGLVLETFHGFKVAAYLDLGNDTRRLMWTLAHAHGVLIGLIHVVFGLNLAATPGLGGRHLRLISGSLRAATVLLPGGFFAGGVVGYGGDPGLGILVVPIGAAFLLVSVFLLARDTKFPDRPSSPPSKSRAN
jgi:hypothetical protein